MHEHIARVDTSACLDWGYCYHQTYVGCQPTGVTHSFHCGARSGAGVETGGESTAADGYHLTAAAAADVAVAAHVGHHDAAAGEVDTGLVVAAAAAADHHRNIAGAGDRDCPNLGQCAALCFLPWPPLCTLATASQARCMR